MLTLKKKNVYSFTIDIANATVHYLWKEKEKVLSTVYDAILYIKAKTESHDLHFLDSYRKAA